LLPGGAPRCIRIVRRRSRRHPGGSRCPQPQIGVCTELLSLSSKLAALHAQCVNDPVVLDAVNDIEVLASNLSNKIWQKIVILDTMPGLE